MRMRSYKRIYADRPNGEEMADFAEDQWRTLVEYLKKNDAFDAHNGEMAHRLVIARTGYEFLLPIVNREGEVKEGPNGGDYFNQNFGAMMKYAAEAEKLETRLHERIGKKPGEKPTEKPKVAADRFLGPRPN